MIHSLRKKMILVSAVSIILVIIIVYLAIFLFEVLQLSYIMDTLTVDNERCIDLAFVPKTQ